MKGNTYEVLAKQNINVQMEKSWSVYIESSFLIFIAISVHMSQIC